MSAVEVAAVTANSAVADSMQTQTKVCIAFPTVTQFLGVSDATATECVMFGKLGCGS